jgi:hypothetical protein
MNKEEFRERLRKLQLTITDFAVLVGRDRSIAYQWGGPSSWGTDLQFQKWVFLLLDAWETYPLLVFRAQGRHAFSTGIALSHAPGTLSAAEYEAWREGWTASFGEDAIAKADALREIQQASD